MRDASGDSNRLLATAIAAATLIAIAAVGQSLFFGPYLNMTLAPLAGLAAAVAVRERIGATAAAAVGVLGGSLLGAAIASPAWASPVDWLPTVAVAAGIAAVIAFGAAAVVAADERAARLFSGVCVVLVLAAMCLSVFDRVNQPLAGGGTLLTAIAPASDSVRIVGDETMFALSIRGFMEHKPYYPTMRDLLLRRNVELVGSVETRVPMSYRLPTLYALLAALGGSGNALLAALLALASAAVASAYLLCRRFVAEQFGLLGAVSVAACLAGYAGGVRLLDSEYWAGMLGVVFLAALVWSGAKNGRTWLFVSLAAAVAAALIRELGIAFLLVGAAASLAPGAGTRLRRVAPWLVGIVAALAVYAVHWRSALAVIATLPPATEPAQVSWIQPFGIPLASAVWFTGVFMKLGLVTAIVLFVVGVLGALVSPATFRDRLAMGLVALGGVVVSLFFGAAGNVGVGRLTPPYWAMLFVPSLLACVPLLLARWRGAAPGLTNSASR